MNLTYIKVQKPFVYDMQLREIYYFYINIFGIRKLNEENEIYHALLIYFKLNYEWSKNDYQNKSFPEV